jgi:hypothetical protein
MTSASSSMHFYSKSSTYKQMGAAEVATADPSSASKFELSRTRSDSSNPMVSQEVREARLWSVWCDGNKGWEQARQAGVSAAACIGSTGH